MNIFYSILLLCLWPAVNFFGTNIYEEFKLSSLVLFYLISIFIFSALSWFLYRATGRKKYAIVLSYIAIFFFYLTPYFREVTGGYIAFRYLLAAEGAAVILIVYFISRSISRPAFEKGAFFFSSMLVGLSLVDLGGQFITTPQTEERTQKIVDQRPITPFKSRPNVYFIILDGYGRSDQLLKLFSFDNSSLDASLKGAGFKVLTKSYSAFPNSEYTIGSTFNMVPVLSVSAELYLERFVSPVFHEFRQAGYQVVVLDEDACPENSLCLKSDEHGVGTFGYLEQNLLRMTPLYEIFLKFAPQLYGDKRATVRDLHLALRKVNLEKPSFVYAHIMLPHRPHTRDASCKVRIPKDPFRANSYLGGGRNGYINQLQCVNKQLLDLIADLTARDPDAIVIFQADHGTGFVYWENNIVPDFQFSGNHDWYKDALEERYAILNAWKLPRACESMLSETTPSQDTFRIVFSCLQDTPYMPNENESFWVDRTVKMTVNKIRIGDKWLLGSK